MNFYDAPLSTEEYEAMVNELAERLKNLTYVKAHDLMKELLPKLGIVPGGRLNTIHGERAVIVNCTMRFLENDLAEIVAGMRRQKEANR